MHLSRQALVFLFAMLAGCSLLVDPDKDELGAAFRDGAMANTEAGTEAGATLCASDHDCLDDNPCNGVETCDLQEGTCVSGEPVECEIRDTCREGTCNPSSGECEYALVDARCASQNACEVGRCTESGCRTEPIVCDDGSPCTRDFCDESQGCLNELIDEDGDGQASDRLGRCGTDCDDDDNRRYQGATEYCDGVDNNCNGQPDAAEECVVVPDTCFAARDALPELSLGQTLDVWNGPIDLFDDDYSPDCFNNTGRDAAFEIRVDETADIMAEAITLSGDVNPKLMVVPSGTCGSIAFDRDANEKFCNENATESTNDARLWVQDTRGFDLLLETDDGDEGTVAVKVTVMSPKPQQCGNALDISAGGTWIGQPRIDQDYAPDCSSNENNPQGIAVFTGPSDRSVRIVAQDDFRQSVLELTDGSCESDLECNATGGAGSRTISTDVTTGATYHVAIEGSSTDGAFAVEFRP